MKRSISIIAVAAMAASLTLAGAVNAYADEEPTTQASTEAATQPEASISIEDITGKWKYEVNNSTDDKEGGIIEVKADSTYTFTKEGSDSETGTVKIGTEEIGGSYLTTVNFYVGEEMSFGGYYHADTDSISIGNGGTAQLVRYNGESETTTTTEAETTTAASTDTTASTSTSTTSTTTTAATTTAKATTTGSGSPRTGVALPAMAIAGIGAAAATAFVLRKKED